MKYTIKLRTLSFLSAIAALISLLLNLTPVYAKQLKIIATTSDLASIAESIAGEFADVKGLATGKQDPHFLQAKPSYIIMARRADLWVRVGMELEIGWEQPIIDGARNKKIRIGSPGHLDASENILKLELPSTRVTRSMGDVHPSGNPHYWTDPYSGRIIAETIAGRLTEIDPEHEKAYKKNLALFQNKLDEKMFGADAVEKTGGDKLWVLHNSKSLEKYLNDSKLKITKDSWLGKMRPFKGNRIITYHRSWVYFTSRFDLDTVEELEPKPGIPPSPGHVLELIKQVKKQNIPVLLMEPFYSRKAPNLIASKTGIQIAVCANSVGGEPVAVDYLSMIGNIVEKVSAALEKAKNAGGI